MKNTKTTTALSTDMPKILYLDIETSPNRGYFFQLYKENFNFESIEKERSILTFSYKWAGDEKAKGISVLTFHKAGTVFDPYNDKKLVERICEIVGQADYVVGHYAKKFDMRFIRARALVHGITPPPPVPVIDTYILCKKYFNLNANRLDYIGKILGLGRKIPMSWSNWQRCVEGDKKAIAEMLTYNKQDVELLEQVFLRIQPHVETMINRNLFSKKSTLICNSCGSASLQKRGTFANKVKKVQRLCCTVCGSWSSAKLE